MIDRAVWLKAVQEAMGQAESSPEGSLSVREFQEVFHIGRTSAQCRLALLVEQGKARVTTTKRRDRAGRLQTIRVYQLIQNGEAPQA